MIITIQTGNAAFADGNRTAEVARILRALADRMQQHGCLNVALPRDINGKQVGHLEVATKERKP